MRTAVSALAANDPRNVVSASRNRKSPRNVACATRRHQTRTRIPLRAGMPDPGRFGSTFFGFALGFGGAVSAAEAGGDAEAVGADAGAAARAPLAEAASPTRRTASSASTAPTFPSQGMGATSAEGP